MFLLSISNFVCMKMHQVGSLTDHYQTQCYSTHLTMFASGFLALPAPINWDYVFTNADFVRNKTIYLTVICLIVIYLILIIFARFRDRKDTDKVGSIVNQSFAVS